jgi:hypothetical protein
MFVKTQDVARRAVNPHFPPVPSRQLDSYALPSPPVDLAGIGLYRNIFQMRHYVPINAFKARQ